MFTFQLSLISCIIAICAAQFGRLNRNFGRSTSYAAVNIGGDGSIQPFGFENIINRDGDGGANDQSQNNNAAAFTFGNNNGAGANFGNNDNEGFNENGFPKYEFRYGVNDERTGDRHNQKEQRNGDSVQGEYSLQEPDGSTRTVKYSADGKRGFSAQVTRSGQNGQTQAAPPAAVNNDRNRGFELFNNDNNGFRTSFRRF
ncbi:hypothetical protein RI129_004807 [Pyrocoelia pectoralis]|uniref:Uncharacterized protein n=1 Tax=Pyrocoelia pectoralis TaxID=417401 RepID=A0AAN7ZR05_9COLE